MSTITLPDVDIEELTKDTIPCEVDVCPEEATYIIKFKCDGCSGDYFFCTKCKNGKLRDEANEMYIGLYCVKCGTESYPFIILNVRPV